MKHSRTTFIALSLILLSSSFADGQNSTESSHLQTEVERLNEQNQELISSLKSQIEHIKKQRNLIDNLSQRVDELESENSLDDFDESQLNMKEEPSISFGGWLGFLYSDNDKESTNAGFDVHPLYMYAKAKPSENWDVFAEIEIEHLYKSSDSGTKGELKVERLYIQHEFEDTSRLRLGKFFLPFGYWYNTHWHFLTETLSRPISFNNSYVPKQQVGIEYLNNTNIKEIGINYQLWLGNGPDLFGTNERTEKNFSFGGALFAERNLSENMTIGATFGFHQQTVDSEKESNAVFGAELKTPLWEFRGEYYLHGRSQSNDLESGYLSTVFNLNDSFAFVHRYDFGDDEKLSKFQRDPEVTSNSLGFVWRPKPHLLLKGEYRMNNVHSSYGVPDFNNWNLFTAVKF